MIRRFYCLGIVLLLAGTVHAQRRANDALHQFNDALAALTAKVSPAVVQISVTGYGPVGRENGTDTAAVIGVQHSLGSGVIVDPSGFIMTNAHVVEGAQRTRVTLATPVNAAPGKNSFFEAHIVGVHHPTDLALLKIDGTGLPFLSLDNLGSARQGQLVIALGSPGGLENSVTMGVISSVARQPDPDRPGVYIQTDAPINPGNSGGPLVDVDGALVGINTFILTQGGGSEGLGFAVPAAVVKFIYGELRAHGHVHRSEVGAIAQTITPSLAAGLGLPQAWGVIIADVIPGGPADAAGLKVGDIIVSADGKPIESLPVFEGALYLHPTKQPLALDVLRGSEKVSLSVPVVEQKHEIDNLAQLADPEKCLVPRFGVLAVDVNERILKLLPDARTTSGVLVVARTATPGSTDAGLLPGDLLRSINGHPVTNVDQFRASVRTLKPGDAVVLQIERQARLQYLAFEME